MKTKCKSTRKKGQSKYKLKGFRLTVCKAVRPSALSSPALHRSQSSLSRLLWGVSGEGLLLFLVCPLKTNEISGSPQGASAGSAFISVSQHSGLSPPFPSTRSLCPSSSVPMLSKQIFTFRRVFRNYTSQLHRETVSGPHQGIDTLDSSLSFVTKIVCNPGRIAAPLRAPISSTIQQNTRSDHCSWQRRHRDEHD